MPRKRTPTFSVELPLSIRASDEREMLVRLELGRQLYNACLGEALKRLRLMRDSKAWARACSLPRVVNGVLNPLRQEAFAAAALAYGFTSADISSFASQAKNDAGWNEGRSRTDARLGAHEVQRLAERVFKAAQMYCFGKRGRPRFKGKIRPLHSLEGKSDISGLRWNSGAGCLQWGALTMAAKMPPAGRDPWLSEALTARTKYARVLWRNIKGKRRWFVQLMQEGLSPLKYESPDKQKVGLDIGPSSVAVFSEQAAALAPLAPEVEQPWADIRRLQRAMDRSRRATNPQCYNEDRTWEKGEKVKVRSNRYEKLRAQLAERERVLARRRSRSHGRLSNRVLACGNQVQAETLSYKAFQRSYGRSTKIRAAGSFMALVRRKAARAGGALVDLNTWRLKMSQYDHITRSYTKKALSERWHRLGDGSGVVQRDLYSAFLATYAGIDTHHPRRLDKRWPDAQSLLSRAGWMRKEPVSVASLLATAPEGFGLPTPERVVRERALACGEAANDVGESRESQKAAGDGLKTSRL